MIDQYMTQFQQALGNPWWRAGIIIGAALVIGIILRLVLLPILNRLVGKTSSKIDDHILAKINLTLIRLVVLQAAHLLVRDWIPDTDVVGTVDSLYITLLALFLGKALLDISTILFLHLSEVADKYSWIQDATLPLFKFAFKVVLFGIQTYVIMSAWHINLTSWLASAGVLGIAIGFAAKDTLANFISGIFILVDAPYKVGQYIFIDGQTRGVVTDIGMRSTRLLTNDNVEVTVPNGVIGNSMIINETSGPSTRMRVRVNVGVAYGSDVEQVRNLLMACTEEMNYLEPKQKTVVRFTAMGESSLDFQVLVWTRHPAFRGKVIDILNTRIYQALQEASVEIPFPQRDINIKAWPSATEALPDNLQSEMPPSAPK
jgi:MscS family membrane protein